MSDNKKPESSFHHSRGFNRSRGGHSRASAHAHRFEPYSNPGPDRYDHHHHDGGDHRIHRTSPQWVARHPLGFHHDRGCEQCAQQRRHVTEAIRTEPELAARIAQASLDDPEALRAEVEDARRNWSLCQDDLEDCERELDNTWRELERVQSEIGEERRRRDQAPSTTPRERAPRQAGTLSNPAIQLDSARQTIGLLQQQLAEAGRARDNYRLHTEELTTHLLRLGHSVVAASGADASTTLPRPFFSVTNPAPGGNPSYVVPNQDADVEMGDGNTAPPSYQNRTFVLGSTGALTRQRADIFDMSTDEGEEVESDEEDFDDDGDIGRPKASSKGKKGKMVAKLPPLPPTAGALASRPQDRPTPAGPRADRRNWPVPRASWDSNPLPADRERWGDESSRARGSDIGPGIDQHTSRGGVRGGRNRPPAPPARLVARNLPIQHIEFNGIPWVARRIPREPIVASLHGQEKYEHERTRGLNAPRPALQPGEIPPGFVAANVTTSEVLRNLMERASVPTNPGARDVVDILGDLRNVAGRALHPRHELENIVMNEYIGKPAWAGGKAHLKQNKKGATAAPPSSTAPAAIETNLPIPAEGSIPDPAPTTEDTLMDTDLDGPVSSRGPTSQGMVPRVEEAAAPASELELGLVGNNAPGVEGSTETTTSPVHTNPPDSAMSTPGTSSIEGMILEGFNIPDPDLAREFMTLLDSAESPLQRPDPTLWEEFVTHRPGMSIFGIPMDNLMDNHRQLRRGFLAVVRRTPRPRSIHSAYLAIQALRDHWVEHPGFVAALPGSNTEMTTDEFTDPSRIVSHLTTHGVHPNELDDITSLLNYVRDASQ
ncbi:hypothetical protein QCA50_006895 [Cerrena zonata]|uniref:Uncharacterized protein n=1 Tax=Cerrena zonata TaxID=2478898 RepID=A0AAW0GKZ0_9APHY